MSPLTATTPVPEVTHDGRRWRSQIATTAVQDHSNDPQAALAEFVAKAKAQAGSGSTTGSGPSSSSSGAWVAVVIVIGVLLIGAC